MEGIENNSLMFEFMLDQQYNEPDLSIEEYIT